MIEFAVHPNVYSTGHSKGLLHMLEDTWVRGHAAGDGTFYMLSGFANYNGGVRFYQVFKHHIDGGGKVVAFLGGSTAQKLSSQQVVESLLEVGVEVNIVNRKRLLHAKCYGSDDTRGQKLVVSSGNFTGPGMSQNVEASITLDNETISSIGFSWQNLMDNVRSQNWQTFKLDLSNRASPGWGLLYDEIGGVVTLDETQEVTMVLVLGNADTARIQATPGSNAGRGTQYFWLSRDCYDFFPPLTIRNRRGVKATYSTIIKLYYVDIDELDEDCRVTFEAENNLDFRLGTSRLRYSKLADVGDLAVISRVGEDKYELRIVKKESLEYSKFSPYAINYIGHRDKRFGYISNQDFERIADIKLPIKKF